MFSSTDLTQLASTSSAWWGWASTRPGAGWTRHNSPIHSGEKIVSIHVTQLTTMHKLPAQAWSTPSPAVSPTAGLCTHPQSPQNTWACFAQGEPFRWGDATGYRQYEPSRPTWTRWTMLNRWTILCPLRSGQSDSYSFAVKAKGVNVAAHHVPLQPDQELGAELGPCLHQAGQG